MNFSAILINVALRAAERAQQHDPHAILSIYITVVFALMALEALLNEQAYTQTHIRRTCSARLYEAVDRGTQGFDRFQAVLEYLFGRRLPDGQKPANDLKLLILIRNGLVHYRFERPPSKVLDQLVQHQRFSARWKDHPIAWPTYVTSDLARWAYETACEAALVIASIVEDAGEPIEADLIRGNFDPNELERLLNQASTP